MPIAGRGWGAFAAAVRDSAEGVVVGAETRRSFARDLLGEGSTGTAFATATGGCGSIRMGCCAGL